MNIGGALDFRQTRVGKLVEIIDLNSIILHDLCRDGVVDTGIMRRAVGPNTVGNGCRGCKKLTGHCWLSAVSQSRLTADGTALVSTGEGRPRCLNSHVCQHSRVSYRATRNLKWITSQFPPSSCSQRFTLETPYWVPWQFSGCFQVTHRSHHDRPGRPVIDEP